MKKTQIYTILYISLLAYSIPIAAQVNDSALFRWNAETVFSRGYQKTDEYGKYSKYFDRKARGEYFVGLVAEYQRFNKKKAPWFSPIFAMNIGWFTSEMYHYQRFGGWYLNNNDCIEFKTKTDEFNFTSIAAIPQLGLNARPFVKKRKLSRLSLTGRLGYQLNWIQHLYSKQTVELEEVTNRLWVYKYSYSLNTSYPSFKERRFPHWYFQAGISNELNSNQLGYRVSFSWQQWAQRGLEIAMTWHIQ